MKHDLELYQKLKKEFDDSTFNKTSDYWSGYIKNIVYELDKNGLNNFGRKYVTNAGGFGDAPKIGQRPLLRKIFKLPFVYKFLEKQYVNFYIKRIKEHFFNSLKSTNYFSKSDLLIYISQKLNNKTRSVNPIRVVDVDNNLIPHSYTKGAIYLDMIEKIIEDNNLDFKLDHLFENNVMDIGGGVGSILHSFYEYHKYKEIENNSKFFLYEQFPVSYIAKQSLEYFSGQNVSMFGHEVKNTSNILVIQNTLDKEITNQNISLFFNSESFQEMDEEQIKDYIEVMKNNASKESYLASFFYPSVKKSNSDKKVIKIFNNSFRLIGWEQNYYSHYLGGIQGILYLYRIN